MPELEQLKPRFLEKVWGSTELEPLFPNRPGKTGEVWLESSHPLPLLLKFIFTTENLSVQVHPGDAYAAQHHASKGKTEMWHVVAAEPGAKVAAGFREPISRERMREASLSGEIESLLNWYDARPGDTFFLPAGTVHAIGAGLVMCEIQQQSDITYRLYDYGRPRELHLEHGLAVSHLGPCGPRSANREGIVADCEYFQTLHLPRGGELASSTEWMIAALHGSGTIGGLAARAGQAFYAPSQSELIRISGELDVLAAHVPNSAR